MTKCIITMITFYIYHFTLNVLKFPLLVEKAQKIESNRHAKLKGSLVADLNNVAM